jgi:tetratricopeptide (TPR) repeat protein
LAGDIDIQPQLERGEFESAFGVLLNAADSVEVDEEYLYYLCITAPTGKNASRYLKEYSQKYPRGKHIEEIRQKLSDYYSSLGMDITAGKSFQDGSDIDQTNAREIYKIALAKQRAGEYDDARDLFRRLLLSNVEEFEPWALLGLADCDLLSGKHQKAAEAYSDILNLGAGSDIYPMALLGLAESRLRAGDSDEARRHYENYRRTFPQAPPLAEFEVVETEPTVIEVPKAIPGSINIGYYVQVGVFGKKENARTCLIKFRNLGYQAKMDEFEEGGQTFQRVMVGPFKDEKSARDTKDRLEKSQGEKFIIFVK